MAAAANKPGAVHYSLIFFVMVSVILGITTYMFHRDASDKIVEVTKLSEENSKLTRAQKSFDDQVQALKNRIGIKLDLVEDSTNPQNPATVIVALANELATNGKENAGSTVLETLRKLRDALDATSADRDSKAMKVATLEKETLALKGQYQAQVDNFAKAAKESERGKLDVVGDREEKIKAKIDEIARYRGEVNTTTALLAEEKESREKERKSLNSQISNLELRIDILKEKIDNLEKLSFEVADGVIRRVEHASRTVWINLGEADYLKTRMTFSVYAKENQGVGRGVEDIKGKIEVTRILGPHMAEARVIDEDLYRPMVSEDLIYTPIWSPGLIEKISIIGDIDLDHDGRSDREQFHQMMAVAGCVIDNEVDDAGVRHPENGKITVQTRFLVRGIIPEFADALGEVEQERIKTLNGQLDEMQKEARANGVRVIKLNDFLAYCGYHTRRRTFLPGQDRPFTLKAGGASQNANDAAADRSSTGNVSGAYSKNRQAPQQNSGKTFGNESK
jgi:hypothetical protein